MFHHRAMGTPQTRYLAKRDEIIAAATALLNEDGLTGFTLAGVAKRIGMHPASLAYYFKKKEDLAATCLMSALERIQAVLDAALKAPTPQEQLVGFVEAMFDLRRRVKAGEELPFVSFNEIRSVEKEYREQVWGAFNALLGGIETIFAASGTMRGRERKSRARLVIEQVMWARVWLAPYEEADYGRAASRLCDLLLHGIAAPGQVWNGPTTPAPALVPDGTPPVTRETFLVAATETINALGYRGASVDKISARLNVTKGSFYYHNADKGDLVGACFERTIATMTEAQTRAAAKGGTGWDRLCQSAGRLIADNAAGRKRQLRTYALSALPRERRGEIEQALERVAHRFAAVISDGIADGSIRPIDPLIAAEMVMATISLSAYIEIWSSADAVFDAYAIPAFTGLFGRAS